MISTITNGILKMPFRFNQPLNLCSFTPVFVRTEKKKKNRVIFEDHDVTRDVLPDPKLYSLKNIIESGNVSKLEPVNTVIRTSSELQFKEVLEKKETETETATQTNTEVNNAE